MRGRLDLAHLHEVSLDTMPVLGSSKRLAVCASGYEERSSHWHSKATERLKDISGENTLVFGFEEFSSAHARAKNDRYYESAGCESFRISSSDTKGFEAKVRRAVEDHIRASGESQVEVHLDYSCMPRNWYCRIPEALLDVLRPGDVAHMWYSPGLYTLGREYPSAGVEDFRLFSGRPSVLAYRRTHFMGIGFDATRSSAIRSVLDPQRIVCFFANRPSATLRSFEKAMRDNASLLDASEIKIGLPMDEFSISLSALTDMARLHLREGDVVLVPDGPKPLILAASLTPMLLEAVGCMCLHVGHRSRAFEPVDVVPRGPVWGFRFAKREPAHLV